MLKKQRLAGLALGSFTDEPAAEQMPGTFEREEEAVVAADRGEILLRASSGH